jgi:hypothetical protein
VACLFLGVSCWRLQTSGVWPSVTVWVVLYVWKDCNAFIFASHPRRLQSAATLLWGQILTSFILSSSFWFHSESHVHIFLLFVSIFSLLQNLCCIQSCANCEYSDYVIFWK